MHPDFVAYAKAVIFDIWDQKQGTMQLNSTFRTIKKQTRMRKKYDDWAAAKKSFEAANPGKEYSEPCPYAARPASGGHSKHNLGTAIDFNLTVGGKTYTRSDIKQAWIATGVPGIINSNGLVWGGVWDNYDPIHMHLAVSESARQKIVDAAGHLESPEAAIAATATVSIL